MEKEPGRVCEGMFSLKERKGRSLIELSFIKNALVLGEPMVHRLGEDGSALSQCLACICLIFSNTASLSPTPSGWPLKGSWVGKHRRDLMASPSREFSRDYPS